MTVHHMLASGYTDFLKQKIRMASFKGFDVDMEQINPFLKPHTREIVQWAVQGGNRAIFASFGLHKTATQIEIARLIGIYRPGLRCLVMPLGIRPLQFDIVDRLIDRYSTLGERIYDPFCGLGTVPYRAIKKGRTGGGSELNATYFLDQVHYLRAAEKEASMPSLFALEEAEDAVELREAA